MPNDKFGMLIPSALPPIDELEIALLRLLGRLEMLNTQQIHQTIFRSLTVRAVQNRLKRMVKEKVLWYTPTRLLPAGPGMHRLSRLKGAYAYGLTTAGKELLDTLEVERDPNTFRRLHCRDPQGRGPDPRTLAHDTQVAWWALNALYEAAHNRYCRGIYAQVEFISHENQRIDVLLIIRLSPTRPRKPEEIGAIPWFDGTPRGDDEIDIRLAGEIDRGTEELVVLLEKCFMYRKLNEEGQFSRLLGGPVLPVFLVQSARRAAQIATEFRDIWPKGWGVVSTPQRASDADGGVLWGTYRSLADGSVFPLLTALQVEPTGQVSFEQVCDWSTWKSFSVPLPLPDLTPEQRAGQKGGAERVRRSRSRKQGG